MFEGHRDGKIKHMQNRETMQTGTGKRKSCPLNVTSRACPWLTSLVQWGETRPQMLPVISWSLRPLRCSAKLSGVNTATELMVQELFRYSTETGAKISTYQSVARRSLVICTATQVQDCFHHPHDALLYIFSPQAPEDLIHLCGFATSHPCSKLHLRCSN